MHTSPEFLDQCRQAMQDEQTRSLQQTSNWAHVDKAQAHADWDALYQELTPLINAGVSPSSAQAQALIARHFALASRFYLPSPLAYIGMGLFYCENPDMHSFHKAYHPNMPEFLREAMRNYALTRLEPSPAAPLHTKDN